MFRKSVRSFLYLLLSDKQEKNNLFLTKRNRRSLIHIDNEMDRMEKLLNDMLKTSICSILNEE